MLQLRQRLYSLLYLVVLCLQHHGLSRQLHIAGICRQRQPLLGGRIERIQRILFSRESILYVARLPVVVAWANPLDNNYKAYENELLNRNLYKHTIGYSRGNGNQVALSISWRLSRGGRHKAAERRIRMSDTDNGIMK